MDDEPIVGINDEIVLHTWNAEIAGKLG